MRKHKNNSGMPYCKIWVCEDVILVDSWEEVTCYGCLGKKWKEDNSKNI